VVEIIDGNEKDVGRLRRSWYPRAQSQKKNNEQEGSSAAGAIGLHELFSLNLFGLNRSADESEGAVVPVFGQGDKAFSDLGR
jgi:hypothetical protein